MSRKMNRRQMSPVKIKSITEQRRSNLNADIHRIINHAAKLISKYNRNTLDKLVDEDLDNQTKIDKLIKESVTNLPRISLENDPKRSRKRKRKKQSTGKKKKDNNDYESDKIEYHFSFEDQDSDGNQQTSSKSEKHRNSLQSKNSVLSIKLDQKLEDLSNNNDEIVLKGGSPTISSDLSIDKSTSCSICSEKHVTQKNDNSQPQNMTDLRYIYEVEIKTGNEKILGEDVDIAIQLYGESKNMPESIKLNEINSNGDHKLFTPGNVDKFSIVLDECLGSILRVKIGIESENDDTLWDLDYLCVRDCLHKSDYFFSCRRCLGVNSSDKLTEVTLVYTPPFKMNKHDSLSKSNTENLDEDQFVGSFKFKKSISKSNNSSRSHSSLYQQIDHSVPKSEQVQQLETNDDLNTKHKEKSDDKDSSIKTRNLKISSTISNDERSTTRSHRSSLSSPESDKNQLSKEVYSMESVYHDIDIHSAVRSHNILRVKQLCEIDGNKKNETDENGCSPIHLAGICFQDIEECKELFQYLISLGIDINMKSTKDLTCLHYAVIANNLLAVKYLIEYCGADPNITDENGDSSLQIANKYNFTKIAKYLANIKKNNESINNDENKDPNSNLTIGRNSSGTLIDINQSANDFYQRNQDGQPNSFVEEININSISKDKTILENHNESSELEDSDNSRITPMRNSFTNIRDISAERKVSVTSSESSTSDSSSYSEKVVIMSTPDSKAKQNSKSLSSIDIKENTSPIVMAHQPNSSRSFESKDGKLLLDQPILINNLNLSPISTSTDNNPVEILENVQHVESERKSDKDSLDNQESRQLDAENYGLMLHKSLPDRENRKFSLSSSKSKASKGNSNISSKNSTSSENESDIKQTSQNTEIILNKNNLEAENLEMKETNDSVESAENLPTVESERKEMNKTIIDKDNPDNLESRQLEAESQGIMLHKSIPNRKEFIDDELSNISLDANESKVSSGNSVLSSITPRSHSDDSLSDIVETYRNENVENSNKNPVEENVQMKTENVEDNNENLIQTTSSGENNNKDNNNISKAESISNDTQQDHSILKGQLQSTLTQSS